ncbi:MAG: hypothetical protein ACPG49_10585 [Chitinophagales bacterium]
MRKSFYLLSIFIIFLSACQPNQETELLLNDSNWTSSHFLMTMPSHQSSDSTYTIEANETTWERVLEGQPSKLHFGANGEYTEEHFGVNSDLILKYEGKWTVIADSLILDIQKPLNTKHAYKISILEESGLLKLSQTRDLDRDKQKDDNKTVTYKKK